MWFRCGGAFDHYFVTNLLLGTFWKNFWNSSTFGKVMGDWLFQAPCAAGHCPAERWRTRLGSEVWRAGTVVTDCIGPYHVTINTIHWPCLRDRRISDWCVSATILVTRRLMLSVTKRYCVRRRFVATSFFFVDGCAAYSRSLWPPAYGIGQAITFLPCGFFFFFFFFFFFYILSFFFFASPNLNRRRLDVLIYFQRIRGFTTMRYINLRFTYFTYLLTSTHGVALVPI